MWILYTLSDWSLSKVSLKEHHSFWADSKEQQTEIFEQFVNEVTKREEFVIFCYGGYERTFHYKNEKEFV